MMWKNTNTTKSRHKLCSAIALAALITGSALLGASAATADDGTPPPGATDGSNVSPADPQAEIDAITDSAAQEDAQELYDALVAEGRDVVSIQSAAYVQVGGANGEQQARSMPSDCHMTLGISRSGQNIFNDTKTDCSANFQQVTHEMRISGQNPFNVFDTNVVRYDNFVTTNALSAWNTQVFPCNNYNSTNWYAQASGALMRSGTIYRALDLRDDLTRQDCGW